MKKFILTILFCLLSIFTFANDWEFGSEGEHIIPLKGSNMSIKKEKITLKLTKDGMLVDVKFVFDNPKAENKIIGFVTPEGGNHYGPKSERSPAPLQIKNFKTFVNGKEVKSNVVPLSELLSQGILDNNVIKEYKQKEEDSYNIHNYVYYFNTDFKKGKNVVEHSYFYTGASGLTGEYSFGREFEYILTTISKWKNQTVENFEIEFHPGNYPVVLPYTFWNNDKKVDWKIIGKGKITSTDPIKPTPENEETGFCEHGSVFIKLKKGYVRYKTKNFSPDMDFSCGTYRTFK